MLNMMVGLVAAEMKDAVPHLVAKMGPVLDKKTKNRNECFFRTV